MQEINPGYEIIVFEQKKQFNASGLVCVIFNYVFLKSETLLKIFDMVGCALGFTRIGTGRK